MLKRNARSYLLDAGFIPWPEARAYLGISDKCLVQAVRTGAIGPPTVLGKEEKNLALFGTGARRKGRHNVWFLKGRVRGLFLAIWGWLTVGQVARLTGKTKRAIRYWPADADDRFGRHRFKATRFLPGVDTADPDALRAALVTRGLLAP